MSAVCGYCNGSMDQRSSSVECDGNVDGCARPLHPACAAERFPALQAHIDTGNWFDVNGRTACRYCPECAQRCVDFLTEEAPRHRGNWPGCRLRDWTRDRPWKELGSHGNYSPTSSHYGPAYFCKLWEREIDAAVAYHEARLDRVQSDGGSNSGDDWVFKEGYMVEHAVEYGRVDWSNGNRLSLCRAPAPYTFPDVPAGHPLRAAYDAGQHYARRCNVHQGFAPNAHLD